jgi:hypothetical protein
VHVNCDLNWSLHVNEVVEKANKISNVILHGFRCHNVDLYMSAFNTYVKPVVEYCNYVWNPVLCRDINAIENIQRSYTRLVYWKCVVFLILATQIDLNILMLQVWNVPALLLV